MQVVTGGGLEAPSEVRGRGGTWWRRAWLRWGAASVLASAMLMYCYLRIAGTIPVVSDGAGDALQAQDILHGNVLLHGWWATDVSFWPTELWQYSLVETVAGLRPEVVHICAAMTYTLLVLLAVFAAKGRAIGAEAVSRALIAVLVMVAPEPGPGAYVVLSSPDHIGTAVPVLLMLLLLDWAPRRWWVPVAAAVLLTWGLVADELVLLVGVLPLAAVCLARAWRALRRSQVPARALWFELSLAAAAALAALAARGVSLLVQASGGFRVNDVNGLISPRLPLSLTLAMRDALSLFGADIGSSAGLWGAGPGGVPGRAQSGVDIAFAAVHLAGVAAVVAALALAGRRLIASLARPDGGHEDLVSDLLVVAIAANLFVYIFMFDVNQVSSGREIGPVLSLGAALAGRQLGGPLARAARTGPRAARTVLRPALAALVACFCVMLVADAARPQVPPDNAALAGWLDSHGLHSGLADYLEAASITLDSGGQITMVPLLPTLTGRPAPYYWETDTRLFNPATHRATFLVLAPDARNWAITPTEAIKTFGPPAGTYRYQAYTIMVWHKNLLYDLGPSIA